MTPAMNHPVDAACARRASNGLACPGRRAEDACPGGKGSATSGDGPGTVGCTLHRSIDDVGAAPVGRWTDAELDDDPDGDAPAPWALGHDDDPEPLGAGWDDDDDEA